MKIAVATTDGVSLSQHFGKSKGFLVFDIDGSAVQNRELRTNADTPHNDGICNHGQQQQGTQGRGILNLLSDCTVMLCGGMGVGAAQSMTANGIKPVIIPGAYSAEDAIKIYMSGNVPVTPAGLCNCHH